MAGAVSGAGKRARDGHTKGEAVKVKSEAVKGEARDDEDAAGFDLHGTRDHLWKLGQEIQLFGGAFDVDSVHADGVPIVLHFSIAKWAGAFDAKLRELGLDESAAHLQVAATLTLGLARWLRTVSRSNAALAFAKADNLLIAPYVEEGVRLGYFEDRDKSIDKIRIAASGRL